MSVACTLCGVSMAVAEQPGHRGNVVAPYHTSCAMMDYMWSQIDKHPMPGHKAELQRARTKLIHKWQNVPDEFP